MSVAHCARVSHTQVRSSLELDDDTLPFGTWWKKMVGMGDDDALDEMVEEDGTDIDETLTWKEEDDDEADDDFKVGLVESALSVLKSQVEKIAEASQDGAQEIKVKVTEYAADVKENARNAGAKILEGANMCNPQSRQRVQAAMAAMRSRVVQVSEFAVEQWPEARDNLRAFAKASTQKLALLGRQLNDLRMTVAEREEIQALVGKVKGKFGKLQAAAISKSPQWAKDAPDALSEFTEKVSELSAKLATKVKDAYQSETTQNTLAMVQLHAGQLAQGIAKKWQEKYPELKAMLGRVASASLDKVQELASNLGAAMCDPRNHERALALVENVRSQVSTLTTAIKEHWPEVKQKLLDFVDLASEKAHGLKVALMGVMKKTQESEVVNDALSKIQEKLAIVKESGGRATEGLTDAASGLVLWGKEGWSDMDENEVEEAKAASGGSCFVKDTKFHPANMAGTRRTPVDSAEECQQLCSDTKGCVHFSYWPNGGCHMQDQSAKMRRAPGVVSGPAEC